MPLYRLVTIGRMWIAIAIAGAVLGGFAAYVAAERAPASFISRATVMVGPPPGAGNIAINDVLVAQQLAPTYAQLATTRPILERAIATAGVAIEPGELASEITTNVMANSSLIDITVSHPNGPESAALANAVAGELSRYLTSSDATTASKVAVTMVDPAIAPSAPDRSRVLQGTLLGAGAGLALVIACALVVESYRRRSPSPMAERAMANRASTTR